MRRFRRRWRRGGAATVRAVSLAAAATVAAMSFTPVAQAQTFTWNNLAGGTFNTATNWSPATTPSGAAAVARFALNNTYTVSFSAAVSHGTLDFAGGTVNFVMGANTYTPGVARFSGGSFRVAGGLMNVPTAMSVLTGATVDTGGGTISGGTGTVSGGRLIVSTDAGLRFPQLSLSSGTIQTTSGALTLGLSITPTNISMTGGAITGTELDIGYDGVGTMTQSDGAVATNFLSVGRSAAPSGAGRYTLSGGGSITTSVAMVIGEGGQGTFVQSGGAVSCGALELGVGTGSGGTLSLNSGTFTANQLVVAANGAALVQQSGGAMSVGAAGIVLGLGTLGSATYQLGGGSVSSAGSLVLGAGTSTFTQTGGTLAATTVAFNTPGVGVYSFTGGTLNITNGDLLVANGGLLGPDLTLDTSRIVSISGTTTVAPLQSLTINAGTFSTGSLVNNGGAVRLNGGTLRLTASDFVVGAAGPMGDAVQLDAGQRIETTGARRLVVNSGAALVMNGGVISAAGGASIAGQLTLASPLSNLTGGVVTNDGLITGTGRIGASLTNNSLAEIRANPGEALQLNGGSVTNNGLISVLGGTIDVAPPLQNNGWVTIAGGELRLAQSPVDAGTISMSGGVLSSPGQLIITSVGRLSGRGTINPFTINNSGTVMLSGGLSDVGAAFTNFGGKVIVTGNSTSTFYNTVQIISGEFRVSAGSTAVFFGPVTGLGSFTGPGTKDFEGSASAGPVAAGGATIVGPGGALNASYVREQSLSIEGDAAIAPDGTAAAVSRVKQLNLAGATDAWTGRLDLSNNALVIDYDGASPLATVTNQIKQGFNHGPWTGDGITSSSAALTVSTAHRTALGYAEASSLGTSTFLGQAVDATALLVRYVPAGDANLDGGVDLTDFTFLASHFNQSGQTWLRGDFDYNGTVDLTDFTLLAANFNYHLPSDAATIGAPVPEPAALFMVPATALAAMARRQRRASSDGVNR